MDLLRIVLAIFLPPIAVFLTVGIMFQFWLNLVLTLFGILPGSIHALWVVIKSKEKTTK